MKKKSNKYLPILQRKGSWKQPKGLGSELFWEVTIYYSILVMGLEEVDEEVAVLLVILVVFVVEFAEIATFVVFVIEFWHWTLDDNSFKK